MGVMQLCTTSGWKEVGGSVSSSSYTTVTNQPTATVITSNAIAYTGFFGTHDMSVDNGAHLIVNGVDKGTSTKIVAGDSVALSVTTTAAQITTIYTVRVGSIQKTWSVTTRNKTPVSLSISPSSQAMNVSGTSGTVYSSPYTFTVTNTGETTSAVLNPAALSSLVNFEFTGTNTCTPSITLAQGQTCTLQVRSKATAPTTTMTASNLTISDGTSTGTSNLSGTASGWSCTLDGQTTLSGNSSTYYSATTSGSCAGIAQSRTCTDGTLGGSATYQYATCIDCTNGAIGAVCPDGAFYIGMVSGIRVYAASADSGSKQWKTTNTATTGTDSTTDGKANTAAMIAAGAAAHPAGSTCNSKSPAGTWYLPAKSELALIWTNSTMQSGSIDLTSKGFNTTTADYSSSTQSSTLTWFQSFSSPLRSGNYLKTNSSQVRCVRQ